MADPDVIYLSVACNPDCDFGRTWSENGDGPDCDCGKDCEPVKYIRADLVAHHILGRAPAPTNRSEGGGDAQ